MRPKGAGRTYSRSLWIGDDGSVVRRVCFLGTRVILSRAAMLNSRSKKALQMLPGAKPGAPYRAGVCAPVQN